jgi:hypothetical protein
MCLVPSVTIISPNDGVNNQGAGNFQANGIYALSVNTQTVTGTLVTAGNGAPVGNAQFNFGANNWALQANLQAATAYLLRVQVMAGNTMLARDEAWFMTQ